MVIQRGIEVFYCSLTNTSSFIMAWAGHGQIAGQTVRTVAVGAIDFSHSLVVILVLKKRFETQFFPREIYE